MKKIIAIGLLISLKTWAGCNSPNNIMVTVDITAPTANQKITMNSINSTFTTLTAASSGDDDTALTWTFTGFVFPSGNTGASVAANTPANWPADNSFWGEKTVKLEYSGGTAEAALDCEDSGDVKVFFPPAQDISNEPAWFKYWQDETVPSLDDFIYQVSIENSSDTFGACDPNFTDYWFKSCAPILYIASTATSLFPGAKGVDNVEYVVGHELGHKFVFEEYARQRKVVYDAWLNTLMNNPYPKNSSAYEQYVTDAEVQRDEDFLAIDVDGDQVPDTIDPNGLGDDDHEAYADSYAISRPYSVVTGTDWSAGGKNDA
jgi:hypothetical protein